MILGVGAYQWCVFVSVCVCVFACLCVGVWVEMCLNVIKYAKPYTTGYLAVQKAQLRCNREVLIQKYVEIFN